VDFRKISDQIDASKQEMSDFLMQLIQTPAIAPESGGEGEFQKAELLTRILTEIGFDKIEHYDSPDKRVHSGTRPNITAFLNGEETANRLWLVTHMDVVPSGEESLWKVTKAFEPMIKDGCIFGRGSEDNGQSLVASIFAAKALKRLKITPKRTLALAFVSDEEQGSTMGIKHLIDQGIFHKNDLVIVPDSGNENGSFIEIAEKSILWLKILTIGKQTHGSVPQKGLNAHRIGMQVALSLDEMLHEKYNAQNDYFMPPTSTFEPTRKEKNVDAINIVPGEDIIFFDCRILPQYDVEEVMSEIIKLITHFENKTGAKINVEIVQKQVAPPLTDNNPEIVTLLKKAIKEARGIEASVGGIGGGTCAAFFRKAGIPAVVWSTIDEVAHQPDEYAKISNLINDAKIFALLATMK
jgi:succinyl-diaminopimelate desuccinylase